MTDPSDDNPSKHMRDFLECAGKKTLDDLHSFIAYEVARDEDAASDIYLNALYSTAGYAAREELALPKEELRRLLFHIAKLKIKSYWKAVLNRPSAVAISEDMAALVAAGFDCDVERRIDVERAMRALKPLEQTVILLKYLGGLGVAEIAERIERSESRTKQLLKKARRRLAVELAGYSTRSAAHPHPRTGPEGAQA